MKKLALLAVPVVFLLLLGATPSPPSDATPTRRGLINLGPQAFAGTKTFDGGIFTARINGFEVASATADNLTLYVDPIGSDLNACTNFGDAGCATIQGAIDKVPAVVRDLVTINVANGSYAGFSVNGLTFSARNNTAPRGLLIQGNLVNVTPATGSATGTLSSVANISTNAPGLRTVTDSTQTWTTNDLRGKFFVATGGGGAGQNRVIASNTATTLTLVAGAESTAFAAATTYAIQQPGAVITTGVNGPATATAAGAAGLGFWVGGNLQNRSSASNPVVQIQRVGVSLAGGILAPGIALFGAASSTRLVNVTSVVTGASASAINVTEGSEARVGQCFFSASGTNSQAALVGSTSAAPVFRVDQSYFYSTGANTSTFGGAANVLGKGVSLILNTDRSLFECTALSGSSSACVGVRDGATISALGQNTGPAIISNGVGACLEVGRLETTVGALTSGPASNGYGTAAGLASGFSATNCEVGVRVTSEALVRLMTAQVTTATTGLSVQRGGRLDFIGGGTMSYTSVTNELSLDGTTSTQATFEALSPRVSSSVWGSYITRP